MSSGASNMSVLLGKMEISIEATLTPIFQLTPLPILQSAGDVFLEQIMMPMKEQVRQAGLWNAELVDRLIYSRHSCQLRGSAATAADQPQLGEGLSEVCKSRGHNRSQVGIQT
eukprot:scaffold207_cov409-Prasinococcus_capsulatus_cf.AAC.111